MTIICFLGFHKWASWSYALEQGEDKGTHFFRTCEHCDTTDINTGLRYVRTKCLIKYVRPMPYKPIYLNKITLDEWYFEYLKQEQAERDIRGK